MASNQANYAKRWQLDRSRGVLRYRDISRAQDHIRYLLESGLNISAIAEKSGLSISGVNDVKRGRREKVQLRVEQAILRVTPADANRSDGRHYRDATGARRRARALCSLGYSIRDISRRTGLFHNSLRQVIKGERASCEQATHDVITALYADLWRSPGPSVRARNWAASLGWPMPLDLDEGVDDPLAPEPTRDATKKTTRGIDLDEWLFLVRGGEDPERAARRLGVGVEAIVRAAERHNRPEIASLAYPAVRLIRNARERESEARKKARAA